MSHRSLSSINTGLICLTLVLVFLGTIRLLPISITTLGVNKLILPLIFLGAVIKNSYWRTQKNPSLKVFLLTFWLLTVLVGTLFGDISDKTWQSVQLFWLQLVVFGIGYVCSEKFNPQVVEKFFLGLAVVVGLHSLLIAIEPTWAQIIWDRFFFDSEITRYNYDLARGRIVPFLSPYIFSPFIFNHFRKNAKLAIVLLVLVTYSAVASGYRQIFMTLLVTTAAYLALNRKLILRWRWSLLGLLLGLLIIIATGSGLLFERFISDDGGNFISRFALYEQAFDTWQGSPMLGVGKGNMNANVFPGYEYIFDSRDRVVLTWNVWIDFVHNYFLELLADTGLLGLFWFIFFNFLLSIEAVYFIQHKSFSELHPFVITGFVVLLGYWTDNLFAVSYINDFMIVWLIMGLMAGIVDQSLSTKNFRIAASPHRDYRAA